MSKIELRDDQADTIVCVLEHTFNVADPENVNGIDKLTRKVTRRRCYEIIQTITASFPEAGK